MPLLRLLVLAVGAASVAGAQPRLALDSPSPQPDGYQGFAVASVPDVDGDGQPDVLVGAYGESDGPVAGAGLAHLYSGATGALLRTLRSPSPGEEGRFGIAVAGVPDLDGDARGDLLIGAAAEDVGIRGDAGRAYLFSGATGALLRSLTSATIEDNAYFGRSVAAVPDATGDGLPDLLVGAYSEDGGAINAGRAYLFDGAGGPTRTLVSPNPEQAGGFGVTVAGVTDLTGDGRGELLIGAYLETDGAPNAGRVYLLDGATGARLLTLKSPAPVQTGFFGFAIASVPDLTDDGRPDLLAGSITENGGFPDGSGSAHVFDGATGTVLYSLASPTPSPSGFFGGAVEGVPDVDGDGRGDVLIGAGNENGFRGQVHLFSGLDGHLIRTLGSPEVDSTGGGFGASLSRCSTSGTEACVVVGAAFEDAGAISAGRAYVFSVATVSAPASPEARALALTAVPTPAAGGAVTFRLSLAQPADVRLTLHDLLGRVVGTAFEGRLDAGTHDVPFDASRLPAATYVARLATGEAQANTRVVTTR